MTSVISSYIGRVGSRSRNEHQRLGTEAPDEAGIAEDPSEQTGVEVSENPSSAQAGRSETTVTTVDGEEDGDMEDVELGGARRESTTEDRADRVTLRELEEERELARRRTSACLLLAIFLLFRLWIEALSQSDFGLILVCLVGTSWCVRWIRHNREREEELDRRIAAYLENSEDGTTDVSRNDLRMLSFQAQLALAIMESQRQMLQGGFGHPDGPQAESAGVSEEARAQWERFEFKGEDTKGKNGSGPYNPVAQTDKDASYEEPHCTICLSEYEDGDRLVKFPCGHIYHEECVSSWTSNHTRCPLCNLDLESFASGASSTTAAGTESTSS